MVKSSEVVIGVLYKTSAVRLAYGNAVILNYGIAVFLSLDIKGVLALSGTQEIVHINFLSNLVGFIG